MELYFLATGVKHELDLFETQMQAQPFLLPYKDKDGKEWKQPIYGIFAPINLYRFIFPEEYLDEVVKMLELEKERYPKFDKKKFALRKILGADKIPVPKPDTKERLFHKGNVGLIGIGIKKDARTSTEDVKDIEAI